MPTNESERVVALRALDILDTPPEPAYDEIGELAAHICKCPVGYISFIEDDRLWFKSKYGLPSDFVGCPRELAFCSTTICGAELVTVPDLRDDGRFNSQSIRDRRSARHLLLQHAAHHSGRLCARHALCDGL